MMYSTNKNGSSRQATCRRVRSASSAISAVVCMCHSVLTQLRPSPLSKVKYDGSIPSPQICYLTNDRCLDQRSWLARQTGAASSSGAQQQ